MLLFIVVEKRKAHGGISFDNRSFIGVAENGMKDGGCVWVIEPRMN